MCKLWLVNSKDCNNQCIQVKDLEVEVIKNIVEVTDN